MTALDRLAIHVAASAPPSGELRELLQLHVIDSVGAWIASAATPEGLKLLQFRTAMRGRRTGATLSLDLATSCALARLSEIDDIHLSSMTTPGAIIVPGALTLAASLPAVSTDEVTAAILMGYEVMARLGRAIDGPSALYRGIWTTYFTAPFGIAAVAARLLELPGQATANALALALTLAAPGVGHHNAATTSRWLAIGNAARNGLAAALAAKEGFTSDRNLVDGTFMSSVYGLTTDIAALTDGLGKRSALMDVSFKPWCAARQTMGATQALKEIIDGGLAPAAIDGIKVSVLPPHRKMIDHGVVAGDRASHLTSLQYNMAVSAVAPQLAVALSPSEEPPLAVSEFMRKIAIDSDESLLADYPRAWPARIVVFAGAERHERLVTHVPGDSARPFDGAQVREKFLRFTGSVLGHDKAAQLLARCDGVLTRGDFGPLVADIEQACRSAVPGSR